MHLTAQVGTLTPLLKRALACTKERTPHAVLSFVFLSASDGVVTVRGTDLDATYEGSVEVETDGSVGLLVPPSLGRLLDSMPKTSVVKLTQKALKVAVTCGAFKASLSCMDPREFPTRPEDHAAAGARIEMPYGLFKKMADKTLFCANRGVAAGYAGTLRLRRTPGAVELTASDQKNLAQVTLALADGAEAEIALPWRLVEEAVGLGVPDNDPICFGQSERTAWGGTATQKVWVVRRDVGWPDVNRVIGPKASRSIVNREALSTLAKRIGSTFLVEHKSESGKVLTRALTLELGKAGMAVSSDETEIGSASEVLESTHEGPESAGRVPALQIHAACDAIESENVIVTTDGRMVTVQPAVLADGMTGQLHASACLIGG